MPHRLSILLLGFALLASPALASDSSHRPPPQRTGSPEAVLHSTSGPAGFKTAGPDTFCLYGGPGSTQGKFSDSTGVIALTPAQLAAEGYVEVDVSDQPTLWQRSTFNAANLNSNGPGNHAMWAGKTAAQEPGWVSAPGYGNSWNAVLEFRGTMANPAVGQIVTLDFWFNYDTEPGYDFFAVEYDSAGAVVPLYAVAGSNKNGSNVFVAPGVQYGTLTTGSIVYTGNDYAGGNTEIVLRMLATSDGAWSDEDGLWATDGGHSQVDDITVTWDDGNKTTIVDFEDFEGTPPYLWQPQKAPFAGYFGKVLSLVTDLDPCVENVTPVYGFIDDGTPPSNPSYVGTGTGGTTSINWSYGAAGGWVVNYNGGVSLGLIDLANELLSPEIDWDLPGTDDDDPAVAGAVLRFDVWRHLPLLNGMYWGWSVRGRDGNTGVWGPWGDRSFVYYGANPRWVNFQGAVGDLLPSNRDRVQARLELNDLAQLFAFPGNDATPSPFYDNLTFLKYRVAGPSIVARTIDLFQDSFPQSGDNDPTTQVSRDAMDIRLDMARDISTGVLNTPGDSIIVDVTPAIPGTTIAAADIQLRWQLRPNPNFEPPIRGNLLAYPGVVALPNGNFEGSEPAQPATTASGVPVQDRYFFDLPDQDFFYPGDVLHYYIQATDSGGNVTTLPADLTDFDIPGPGGSKTGGKAGDECVLFTFYSMYKYSPFRVEGKPSIWVSFISPEAEDSGKRAATYIQPEILVVNDSGSPLTTQAFYQSMEELGLGDYANVDIYRVQGPSSGVSNGIGSSGAHGATAGQLAGYSCLVYLGGRQSGFLLSDGTNTGFHDKGDDLGVLTAWHNQAADRLTVHFGDNLPTFLDGGAAGATYLATILGVSVNDGDVRDEIGGLSSPLVSPTGAVPGFSTSFVAYGGCPAPRDFDSIAPSGGALESHDWQTGPSSAAAGVVWDRLSGANRKVDITFPFGFDAIQSAGSVPGGITARSAVLQEALDLSGVHGPEVIPTDAPGVPLEFRIGRAFPNPFNPATSIRLSVPRPGHVRVDVYNLRGERVRTLWNAELATGSHTLDWDGRDARGGAVASGVYLVRVEGFDTIDLQKVVLLK